MYFDTKLKLALKRTAVRNKFRIEDVRSAFKGYANSVKLVNTFFKGEEGLQMLQHYKSNLKTFLINSRSMKIKTQCDILFKAPDRNDRGNIDGYIDIMRTISATIKYPHNEDDLERNLEDTVKKYY